MAMSKLTTDTVANARKHLALGNRYAYAATLSAHHRAGSGKVQSEIESVIAKDETSHLFQTTRNGVLLAVREG